MDQVLRYALVVPRPCHSIVIAAACATVATGTALAVADATGGATVDVPAERAGVESPTVLRRPGGSLEGTITATCRLEETEFPPLIERRLIVEFQMDEPPPPDVDASAVFFFEPFGWPGVNIPDVTGIDPDGRSSETFTFGLSDPDRSVPYVLDVDGSVFVDWPGFSAGADYQLRVPCTEP